MAQYAKYLYKGYSQLYPGEAIMELNGNEETLYLNILFFSRHYGYGFPSQETLSEYMGWSVKKIQTVTNNLERKGFLKVIRKNRHPSKYIPMTSQGQVYEIKKEIEE